MRNTLFAVVLVLLVLLSASLAGAGEKENTSQKVLSAPIAGFAEFNGVGVQKPFNSCDPRQPIPAGPEGTVYRFKVIPQVTTLAKTVTVSIRCGANEAKEYPVYGVNAFPLVTYTPTIDDAPGVSVWVKMKDANYSASDLLWGFGATTRRQDGYFTCYTPILVVPISQWQQLCQEIGTPTNGVEITEAKTANREIAARNAAALKAYRAEYNAFTEAFLAWKALPKTTTVAGTTGKVEVRRSVIRFLRNDHLMNYDGPWTIRYSGNVVKSGEAEFGQAEIGWWQAGADVTVSYGRILQHKVSLTLDEGGFIDIDVPPTDQRDRLRDAVTPEGVLRELGVRHDDMDEVCRLVGTTADEIGQALRSRLGQSRPVLPTESFLLADWATRTAAKWSPSDVEPAVRVSMPDGRAYALQFVHECRNFMVARYVPEPEQLQPDVVRAQGCAPTTTPCALPTEPQAPAKPCLEYPVTVPVETYAMPGSLSSSGSADVRVTAQGVDLSWLVNGFLALKISQSRQSQSQSQQQQIIVNPDTPPGPPVTPPSPYCPTGGDNGPADPPTGGYVIDAPLQPPSGREEGGYDTGGGNAPPVQPLPIGGWTTPPSSKGVGTRTFNTRH